MRFRTILFLVMVMVSSLLFADEERNRRRALIIVNSDYIQQPLESPLIDGQVMADALVAIGFEPLVRQNIRDRVRLEKIITSFTESLQSGDTAVVYYTGHGHQFSGESYMVPVDARPPTPKDAADQGVSLTFLFQKLADAKTDLNVVIVDACRANPFALASGKPDEWLPGLARPVNVPGDTLVAYPTGIGQITQDSASGSPFTLAIAEEMRAPGSELAAVFVNVTKTLQAVGLRQPFIEKRIARPFYFKEPVRVTFRITRGDDDVFLTLDGQDVLAYGSQGNNPREVQLNAGDNRLVIKVFNKRSYEGDNPLWGAPEGWNYTVHIKSPDQAWELNRGEDRVDDSGPQHGKTFVADHKILHVNRKTGVVTLR